MKPTPHSQSARAGSVTRSPAFAFSLLLLIFGAGLGIHCGHGAEPDAAVVPGEPAGDWQLSLDVPPVRVWNNRPSPDDRCRWIGRATADHYADGWGTLIWLKATPGSLTESTRYSGRMSRGRFDGRTLSVTSDGIAAEGRWSEGRRHGPWYYHVGDDLKVQDFRCGEATDSSRVAGRSHHESVRAAMVDVSTANGAGKVVLPPAGPDDRLTWTGGQVADYCDGPGVLCGYRKGDPVEAVAGCMVRGRFHGPGAVYSNWTDTGAWTGRGSISIGLFLYGLRHGEWLTVEEGRARIVRFDGDREIPLSGRVATSLEIEQMNAASYLLRQDIAAATRNKSSALPEPGPGSARRQK